MNLKNRKMKIERLQLNYDGLSAKIDNCVTQQRQIKAKLDTQKSLFSIESNAITLKDIQFSSINSPNFIDHFDVLKAYITLGLKTKYCEFNGNIYLIEDVFNGKMKSYGRYWDLK